jgi:hypothetical protein
LDESDYKQLMKLSKEISEALDNIVGNRKGRKRDGRAVYWLCVCPILFSCLLAEMTATDTSQGTGNEKQKY